MFFVFLFSKNEMLNICDKKKKNEFIESYLQNKKNRNYGIKVQALCACSFKSTKIDLFITYYLYSNFFLFMALSLIYCNFDNFPY